VTAPRRAFLGPWLGLLLVTLLGFLSACPNGVRIALDLINEARRLNADAMSQLDRAAEASQRAVMVSSGEAASAAGSESERARKQLESDLDQIEAALSELNFTEELVLLRRVRETFGAYQALDTNILVLAREKTNHQARELAFGPLAEAAGAFRQALNQLSASAKGKTAVAVQLQCANAALNLREMQVLEPAHIMEAEEAGMARLEQQMEQALSETQKALATLGTSVAADGKPLLEAANAALARFLEVHAEVLKLSHRNSDIQALALSLEQKRGLVESCRGALVALGEALTHRATPSAR
jgi:pyruvate/2-oxoglutarate dehydrogenase complex dihydrolipoamide acyltransferase (E2) component